MNRPNKLPIDGYVIDHTIKTEPTLYSCTWCNNITPNYSRCTLTKVMDSGHCCGDCFDDWKRGQTFD